MTFSFSFISYGKKTTNETEIQYLILAEKVNQLLKINNKHTCSWIPLCVPFGHSYRRAKRVRSLTHRAEPLIVPEM